MWKWLKKLFLKKPPLQREPGDFEVDERARELVALGDKMLATEDYVGAMEAYNSALSVDGHCAEAWYRRGRIFLHDGKILEAAACFVRSLELDPQAAPARCGLGEAILAFLNADKEPLFIRENRIEIISEAHYHFEKSLKFGGDLPRAREGRDLCSSMIKQDSYKLAKPPLFSFHSGGILEKAKREAVSPFLKPGDYRRKAPLQTQND